MSITLIAEDYKVYPMAILNYLPIKHQNLAVFWYTFGIKCQLSHICVHFKMLHNVTDVFNLKTQNGIWHLWYVYF